MRIGGSTSRCAHCECCGCLLLLLCIGHLNVMVWVVVGRQHRDLGHGDDLEMTWRSTGVDFVIRGSAEGVLDVAELILRQYSETRAIWLLSEQTNNAKTSKT